MPAFLDSQTGAIANAWIIRERGQIERLLLQAYRDARLLHLLSISGLLTAIMAGSFFLAVCLLLANLGVVALRFLIEVGGLASDLSSHRLSPDF